ncbi:MAG: aldo/keto reductase [Verrucomicrobiota bacterium]|jgi:predicted aldo/keto reductase-like oxidoreductase|nr:aldo/keto reductase [Verrucomicrobiota bacterium]
MKNFRFTRREFLGTATVTAGAVLAPACTTLAAKRSATDTVTLGKTGIKLSRLGIGLGSSSGNVQRNLGQEEFNRLVRYAFDQGIRYFDCAQSYKTFDWIADAVKDFPRKEIFLMSKIGGNPEKPMEVIENHLKTYATDHIDCILSHCAVKGDWMEERARTLEALELAKQQGKIRAHGVSCHALPALRVAAASPWVDVNLVRVNPQCKATDGETPQWNAPGTAIEPVVEQLKVMRKNGHGVIAMKLIGDGAFKEPDDRERAMRFAMSIPEIDAAVIGFKSPAEIDESIARMNRALA